MVYVRCPGCGTVGYRIRTNLGSQTATCPTYSGNHQKYHCSVCGSRLILSNLREYNRIVVAGGDIGA
jgi:transposase-like protein